MTGIARPRRALQVRFSPTGLRSPEFVATVRWIRQFSPYFQSVSATRGGRAPALSALNPRALNPRHVEPAYRPPNMVAPSRRVTFSSRFAGLRSSVHQHSLANQGEAHKIPPHRFEPATSDAGTHRHRTGIRKLDGLKQFVGVVRWKPTAAATATDPTQHSSLAGQVQRAPLLNCRLIRQCLHEMVGEGGLRLNPPRTAIPSLGFVATVRL